MNSSVLVRVGRSVAAGSAIYAAVAAVNRVLRRTRQRIVVVLGGEWSVEQQIRTTERLNALVADRRIVAVLSSLVTATLTAGRDAGARRMVAPFFDLDLPARVRAGGCVVVIAVLTHIVLLAVIGVPVHAFGWGIRVGLVAAGLAVVWRPGAPSAAWRDRTAERAVGHRA